MSYDLPRKLCAASGCDDLAVQGAALCEEHEADRIARANAGRAKAKQSKPAREGAAFYKTAKWLRLRESFLAAHPLCVDCFGLGLFVSATDVDHIRPHRGDPRLMWDRSNLQGLCKPCHSRKTAHEVWHGARP